MYRCKKTYGRGRRTDGARNRDGRGGDKGSRGGDRGVRGVKVGFSLSTTLGLVGFGTRLDFLWGLVLRLFCLWLADFSPRRRVASSGATFGLHLEVLVHDPLFVGVNKVLRDTAHAEDLGVDTLAAFDGIFDASQSLFVDLLQVHRQATSSVEPTVAVVAPEVLCFLVGEEDSGVVEVALAVVTPRALDELLNLGVVALFDHDRGGWGWMDGWMDGRLD
jgi:hypothetical protein